MNYAGVWANDANGWDFLGYAPGDVVGQQVAKALNNFAYARGETGTWYYSFPTAYPVPTNERPFWTGWYLMKVIGNQNQWWNYGHYAGASDSMLIAWALRWLFQDNVKIVQAVDPNGNGYLATWASLNMDSYSTYPTRVV